MFFRERLPFGLEMNGGQFALGLPLTMRQVSLRPTQRGGGELSEWREMELEL